MAIGKCGECGGKLAGSAKTCPHCGASQSKAGLGCGGSLLVCLLAVILYKTCGGSKTSESAPVEAVKERIADCRMYQQQAAQLALDIRYGNIEPWKARGEINLLKDEIAKARCNMAVQDLAAALKPSTSASVAAAPDKPLPPRPIAQPKPAGDPRCKDLDPEVCAALAKKP